MQKRGRKLPRDRIVTDGLHPVPLQTITRPEFAEIGPEVSIENLQYIGSYNWVNSSSPTIVVPGSPPRWLDRQPPFNVPHDSGIVFVDQNGFRMGGMPLLPLMKATELTSEWYNKEVVHWPSVDFVTDRSNLRKLLRWSENKSGDAFRIDTQLAGDKTVLMNRWEKRTREHGQSTSYGFNFEDATTAPVAGCEKTTSHHRIVKYDLGELSMVVRFEVDALDASAVASLDDDSKLADALEKLKLTGASEASPVLEEKPRTTRKDHGLTIVSGGSIVPQSSILELKTSSAKSAGKSNWSQIHPQLCLSQTPLLYRAYHRNGEFYDIQKTAMSSQELEGVTQRTKDSLKRLREGLRVIKDLVVENRMEGRLSFVLEDRQLKMYKRSSQNSCLPPAVMQSFHSVSN